MDILNVLSIIITAVVFALELNPGNDVDCSVGRENDKTKKIIIRTLNRRRSHCFILIFFILDYCNSLRNASVLNSIRLIFLKLRKCRIIGIEAANNPNNIVGFKKIILFYS